MKILIAGGTGFIGQALVHHFKAKNAQCAVVSRSAETVQKVFASQVQPLVWEEERQLLTAIKDANLIINLTGANIGEKRWTQARKNEILLSRITSTRILAELCASLGKNSPPLFNASAIGVYGLQGSSSSRLPPALDENTPIDFSEAPDFLAEVGRQWEDATRFAKEAAVRVVNMRFAPVLGKSGGVLQKLKMPFLWGLGGKIGSGNQPFSWIALPDLMRAIDFLLEHPEINGPVNFVAPQCVTQAQFAAILAKTLHRPCFVTTPAWLLKRVFGQMADELLLRGQHVKPTVLQEAGFQFQYPQLDAALQKILNEYH